VVIWADRRFRLGHGRAFAVYVLTYCIGRLGVELLRTDPAVHFFGVRLNVFTAIIVGLGALIYLVHMRGRPREVITRGEDLRREAAHGARDEERTGDDAVPIPADGDPDHRPGVEP
jgi:prolipoprotein diacylglyceryltransferase